MTETLTPTGEDQTTTETEETPSDEKPSGTTDDEKGPLKRALDSEREARKQAEKKAKDTERRLAEIENSGLSEVEKERKARETAEAELSQIRTEQARTAARDKALANVGKGYTVDATQVTDLLDGFSGDADAFEAKAAAIVKALRKPVRDESAIAGQPASKPAQLDKAAGEYSHAELVKLSLEDYEAYQAVMKERRKNSKF